MSIIINQRERCISKPSMVYLEIPWENKESSLCTSIKNTIIDFIQTSERISSRFLNAAMASIPRKICLYSILKRLT
jgi:hypothetical protein